MTTTRLARLVITSAAIMATSACGAHSRTDDQMNTRGPGRAPSDLRQLRLAAAAPFDTTALDVGPIVTALGKDPGRIFSFVRDNVAFEAYDGLLRGPRGTLLAMAGNSVDRAALLAAMLKAAGQQVRYAEGTLSQTDARDLIASMWAAAPPAPPADSQPMSARARAFLDVVRTSVDQNVAMLHSVLRTTSLPSTSPESAAPDLIASTRRHYWVQWFRNGSWTDVDPTFADSVLGATRAHLETTAPDLPKTLAHTVTLRINIEESTQPVSSRTVLTYRTSAADLSGTNVTLVHMPPPQGGGIAGALKSSIQSAGMVTPVLLVGNTVVPGEPFRQRTESGGLGGIFGQLQGIGTRRAAAVALREWIDIDFAAPDGKSETVTRELYDVTGHARREAGQPLTAAEIDARTQSPDAFDVTAAVYALTFTTGRIDERSLFAPIVDSQHVTSDPVAALARVNVAFGVLADSLVHRVAFSPERLVLFYPDSPRLFISELSTDKGVGRLVIDLRRSHVRPLASGTRPGDVAAAEVLRGVVEGTLERALVEYVTGAASRGGPAAEVLSTSTIFDAASRAGVRPVLLAGEPARLDAATPEDARARVRDDLVHGFLVVAPQHPLAIAGAQRLAWWRVNPNSGETLAVTDEGLYQTAGEFQVQLNTDTNENVLIVRDSIGRTISRQVYSAERGGMLGLDELCQDMDMLLQNGFKRNWFSPIRMGASSAWL